MINILEKFTKYPSYLKKGNHFLAEKWNVNVEEVAEARKQVRETMNIVKVTGLPEEVLTSVTSDEFPYSNKFEINQIWHKTKEFSINYINKELVTDKETIKENIETWINELNIKPVYQKETIQEGILATLHIADLHVGAEVKNSQYDNTYNLEVIKKRFNKVLQYFSKLPYQVKTLVINDLGDCVDGFNKQTTRGGHTLPQNLNNKEQYKGYLEVMNYLIENLVNILPNTEIKFTATQGNHGGDFEFICQHTFVIYLNNKFPNIKTTLFETLLNHHIEGEECFILTHGKDDKDRKFGLPFNLDTKTETFIQNYINYHNLHSYRIHVIKGDLHRYNVERGSLFKYKNCPSVLGSSSWIMNNFSNNAWGITGELITEESVLDYLID